MIRSYLLVGVVGRFLGLFTAAMIFPFLLALFGTNDSPEPMLYAVTATGLAAGLMIVLSKRPGTQSDVSLREALLLIVFIWVCAAFFGSLPFQFSGKFASFTDALFESASGLTTTGASILADVEMLPPSVQLWRHLTHWVGGIGVVMLMIAVLPLVGYGGTHLYRAQFAGAKSDKLRPRFLQTARSLWKIYIGLTVAEYTALRLAGMSPFDAICHAFSTMGTGGFSTRSASVGGFENPAVEYIIVSFMILASINFTRHYKLWAQHDARDFLADSEVRFHVSTIAFATAIVVISLLAYNGYSAGFAIRRALFQVTSIVTCTGFATADFELWHPLAQLLLLALMYVGGNTGSTAGGLKTFRIVLMLKVVARHMRRAVERHGVFALRVGDEIVPDETASNALSMVTLALTFNFIAALLLTAVGVDVLTSISAVASAMFGVGPALGSVGPAENYGHLPMIAKWVLMVSMLAGRLEFFTFLVIFTPFFWRK